MIRFSCVTKRFPGVVALDDVSFDVAAGTVHAVCGENGAGKSTLGKLLAGIEAPSAGRIDIDGKPARFESPRDALRAGVAMVHQELASCENLSVAENLSLGRLPHFAGFVRGGAARARARELLSAVGADIDPDRAVEALTAAERQLVQIAAAVGAGARVIVFDEPTSSLGPTETDRLYALIGDLKSRGVTILYVSHRLEEIFHLADTVTVLRDGKHVETRAGAGLDEATLVQLMIGRRLDQYFPAHAGAERGAERLRVENLSHPGRFLNVSFSAHAGEVVGFAGLVGAGRSEVAAALFGLDRDATGDTFVNGKRARIRSAADALRYGIGFVPEDRKRQGLVLGMRARENASLPTLRRYARRGWIDGADERRVIDTSLDRVRLNATPESEVNTLSGGNQQKVVLAKWLAAKSDILILDEPTRGVDVGAKAEMHAWIETLASDGCAVILISSELPELLNLSTRIIVLRAGRVVGEVARADATQDKILRLMSGLGETTAA